MRKETQRFISSTLEKKAIDLFLRQIGIMPNSKYFELKELREVISSYIASRFKSVHCCVLWHSIMFDQNNPIVIYLRKNKIQTVEKYEKFSIILTSTNIKFSNRQSSDVKLIFTDENPVNPKYSLCEPTFFSPKKEDYCLPFYIFITNLSNLELI